MPGESEHGTRFARDLRRIRRARGVSLADIHDATKMAYDLIKRFEHDALINHPQFNRVYLRLFVRGYAEHLDLDVEMTLEALDLAIKGRYTGSLAKEYLGESEEERKKESPKKETPKQEKKTSREEPAAAELDQVPEAAPSTQTEKKSATTPRKKSTGSARKTDSGAADSKVTDAEASDDGTSPAEQPAVREASVDKTSAPREVTSSRGASDRSASVRVPSFSFSGVTIAGAAGASPSKGASTKGPAGLVSSIQADPRWIFLGVVVVVVGLGVWGLTSMGSGSDESAQESSSVAELVEPANGMSDATAPANNIPIQFLPDTLNITIMADKGSVAPIRVTVDDDLRRPYWIDRGGSMTFRMSDRIILEQQLDSVTVQVEGMTYPVSRPTGEDMVTLTRDAVHSWFSSIQP